MQDALFHLETPATSRWVYVIGEAGSSIVKIGHGIDPGKRLSGIQVGNPVRLVVRWKTPGGRALEDWLHVRFQHFRLVGEWFDFGKLDPMAEIKKAVNQYHDDPRYKPNEYGCRIIRRPEHEVYQGTSFACAGHCPIPGTCLGLD